MFPPGELKKRMGGTKSQGLEDLRKRSNVQLDSDGGSDTSTCITIGQENCIKLCMTSMRILVRKLKKVGAEGGTRTPTSCLTRPSTVRVCQFRHFGLR